MTSDDQPLLKKPRIEERPPRAASRREQRDVDLAFYFDKLIRDEFIAAISLVEIADYLRNAEHISVVHNEEYPMPSSSDDNRSVSS